MQCELQICSRAGTESAITILLKINENWCIIALAATGNAEVQRGSTWTLGTKK